MRNRHAPIAVEGYPFIVVSLAVTVVFTFLALKVHPAFSAPAYLGFLVSMFVVFFFRNPERVSGADKKAVLAPADGTVVFSGRVVEPHTGKSMEKVSIFMSVFNVHVNRAPVAGRVVDAFYTKGKFLDVRDERASFENEQQGLVIETAGGRQMVVVQVAGLVARRIVCYAAVGDLLERGMRYGLIRFGSRLDVYLPQGTSVQVVLGQKTVAGETVLGMLS